MRERRVREDSRVDGLSWTCHSLSPEAQGSNGFEGDWDTGLRR